MALARMYAPFIILGVANIFGIVYGMGFRDGSKRLLDAAKTAADEAKHG